MKRIWNIIFNHTFIVLVLLLVTVASILWAVSSITEMIPAVLAFLHLFSFLVAIRIINRPMNTSFKLTWILFVLGIPVFGALFYFILQSNLETKRYQKTFKKQAETLSQYRHTPGRVMASLAECDKEQLHLARYMSESIGYPLYTNSDAQYFSSGEAWFDSLIEELKKAKRYIFMEYYIVDKGYMWDSILEILKEKVAQGVEVRFMYDGMNSLSTLPYHYYKTLRSYGIKAKVFSQIIPILSTVQNNRDHRKITIIDGRVAYTGGANIADEYINKIERFGYWKDAAIMVRGEAVLNFLVMFLQMWNYDEKDENNDAHYLNAIESLADTEMEQNAYFIGYGESPFDQDAVAKRVYLDMIQSARHSISIMSPYLVLDDETLDSLVYAAKRGVRVRLLLPYIYDKQIAYLAARTDFETYLKSGIEIYEYTPGFVHSKVMLVDEEKASVGTVNMDFRSFYLNFECGLYIYHHKPVLSAIAMDFEESFAQSKEIKLKEFQEHYPLHKRIAGAFIAIIAPLL